MASESATVEDSGSLADHEAQYSAESRAESRSNTPDPAVEAPPAELPAESPADAEPDISSQIAVEGERDEKGRFNGRQRAKSQQASPEDVPRIAELTRRLRDTEAQLERLKASPPSTGHGHGQSAVPAPATAATPSPKPTPDQFADWNEYTEALVDWKTDQKILQFESRRQQETAQQAQQQKQQRLAQEWTARLADARKEFPDFDAVALQSDTKIPPGSLIDAWIIEHKSGPRVLYHLQQHPEEVTALLQLSLLDQADELSLLSQRLMSRSRGSDASTGSSTAPVVPIAPRPPNPVRTGPLSRADDPPDPDKSSLAEHERFYQPRRARV